MSQHKEQQGFLTVACNTEVDYLHLAYVQALNVKATQKIKSYAVIVDSNTALQIKDYHREIFDYIIEVPASMYGPFGLETAAFRLTPFKETVKLESDLLFTASIDHWWTAFRLRDVVLSTGCKDYKQQPSTVRKYRRVFDDNSLPDTYSGLMYFRYSQTAAAFFRKATELFVSWDQIKNVLLNCRDDQPTTDVVYALTANLIGPELCTIPSADFINFVHMKPAVNNFAEDLKFTDVFVTEFDSGMIRINNVNQYHPIHYYEKTFPTKEMIDYYGSYTRTTKSI
jgi:hypothetical protein